MKTTLKSLWNILSWVVVVLFAVFALFLAGVRFAGFEVFAVLSGSMEPEYPVGSLLYVREVSPDTLVPGDVITFVLEDDTPATHRITEILTENGARLYVTKGDANEFPDANPVRPENILGKPVFVLPYLGRLSGILQTDTGRWCAAILCAVLLISVFAPDVRRLTDKLSSPPEPIIEDDIEIPADIDRYTEDDLYNPAEELEEFLPEDPEPDDELAAEEPGKSEPSDEEESPENESPEQGGR